MPQEGINLAFNSAKDNLYTMTEILEYVLEAISTLFTLLSISILNRIIS